MHPQALCESSRIGDRTRVWAFAHVLPGAAIGADCNICDGVFVENDVVLGDRVTIKSGVQLWDGVRLSDDVFVGPNATFANDKFHWAFFVDHGTVEKDFKITDYRVAIGTGLRLNIPALGPLPLAIDIGVPLVKGPYDHKQLINISVGV